MAFKTYTNEAMRKFKVLFGITSYTSIFLILIISAKLDFVPFIGKYIKFGKYRDFSFSWYEEIGAIFLQRMVIVLI